MSEYLRKLERKVRYKRKVRELKSQAKVITYLLIASTITFSVISCSHKEIEKEKVNLTLKRDSYVEQVIGTIDEVDYEDNNFNFPVSKVYEGKGKEIISYLTFESKNRLTYRDIHISGGDKCYPVLKLAYKNDVRKEGWISTFKVDCDVKEVLVKDGTSKYLYRFHEKGTITTPRAFKTSNQPKVN